jgi:hypothetical protein
MVGAKPMIGPSDSRPKPVEQVGSALAATLLGMLSLAVLFTALGGLS